MKLREFLATRFVPERRWDKRNPEVKYYERAIDRLAEYLSEPEPMADCFSDEILDKLAEWMVAGGFSSRMAVNDRGRLRSVWWHAVHCGFHPKLPKVVRYDKPPADDPVDVPVEFAEVKTLRQFYEHVYRPLRLRSTNSTTVWQYTLQIDHFARFLGHEPTFIDLRDDVVIRFLNSIVVHGNSPATANKARNHILALWRAAFRKRLVNNEPEVPKLIEPRRTPSAWTESELARLFDALKKQTGHVSAVDAAGWWVALHHVLWWSGERITAVLSLRWSDVDLETGWLIVPAQFRKFGLSDKETKLPPEAVDALRAIVQPERELLFPWTHCNRNYLWEVYKRILRSAGLPCGRKDMFHKMRKSAASHFEAGGGNATELLGHSQRSVTRAYLDPRITTPPQAAAVLFSPGVQGGAA